MDYPKELTHISLCAGYGGIDLGLRGALGAVRTIALSEIESFACENLVTKIEAGLLDPAPIWTNLKTFPWGAFRGSVDILSGGFPCQPFSAAGKQAGDEDPRHLFPHILRGISELGCPPFVFLENVEGILSTKLKGDGWSDPAGTPVLLHVLRELERVGYSATAGLFSAREVGLPHQRKRVFILGARCDLTHDQREWVSSLLGAGNQSMENTLSGRSSKTRELRVSCAYGSERVLERDSCDSSRAVDAFRGANMANARSHSGRGADQYGRVSGESVGNTEHNGHPPPSLRRSDDAPLDHRGSCGEDNERKLAGAGSALLKVVSPAPRGISQYHWEPPRVTTEPQRQAEPSLGRDSDGSTCGVDYEELCRAVDNRTDELRMLGNGVVPATAERAFRILWKQLAYPPCEPERRELGSLFP